MATFDADNLTDSELRSKLAAYGHPVGPVTETTRKILIKKLKLLMKQKNVTRNSSKSLTRFSSGDESGSDTDQNGGNRNSRRISMPPPTSYKLTKRKSTPRLVETSLPSVSKVSSSTPIPINRNSQEFKVSRFSSPSYSYKQPQYSLFTKPTSTSTYSYDFDSGSDSDVPDYTQMSTGTRRKSGYSYGSLSSYRSKLNSSNPRNFRENPPDLLSLRLKSEHKKESRPFLSNLVERFTRKSNMYDTLNPFNIKENDVEEDGFSDKLRNVNIPSRSFVFRDWMKPFKSVFQHFKSKDHTFSSNQKSWNSSQLLSMLLLGLFLLFFVWLALAYFRVSKQAAISGKSNHNYPICGPQQPVDSCIPQDELQDAVRLYKDVHIELQAQGLRAMCGPALDDGSVQKPFMTETEIYNFLLRTKRIGDFKSLTNSIGNLKLLLWANRHWGISLFKESGPEPTIQGYFSENKSSPSDVKNQLHYFICQNLAVPWSCYLTRLFQKVMSAAFFITIGSALLYLIYTVWNYYRKVKKEENEQVMAMVEKILEHVSDMAEKANSGFDSNGSLGSVTQEYIPIRHVHDTLIHPTERQKMAHIWQSAVKFIEENESRIRTEVQQVWGEDTAVWRWLGQTLGKSQTSTGQHSESESESSGQLYPDLSSLKAEAKRSSDRVWQGEAFETSVGSMNSLPSSPTQCLKIRHMFKHDKDYGPDWVVKVKDAIVEKCEGARIVHLSVDKESKEGCVYVKCASPQDAGIAYRQLHGSWFDGALITVKYLRLERYHERFPDSTYARTPLRPSNNLRLSLQGTSP